MSYDKYTVYQYFSSFWKWTGDEKKKKRKFTGKIEENKKGWDNEEKKIFPQHLWMAVMRLLPIEQQVSFSIN